MTRALPLAVLRRVACASLLGLSLACEIGRAHV